MNELKSCGLHTCIIQYYSAIIKKEILLFVTQHKWTLRALCYVNKSDKDKYYMILHIYQINLKKKKQKKRSGLWLLEEEGRKGIG